MSGVVGCPATSVFRCSRFPISDGNTIISQVFANGFDDNGNSLATSLDMLGDEGDGLIDRVGYTVQGC